MSSIKDGHNPRTTPLVSWSIQGDTSWSWGADAKTGEKVLGYLAMVAAPASLYLLSWQSLSFSTVQLVVAIILAADIVGGVVANTTNACKRLYHNAEKPASGFVRLAANHWFFQAVHVHPFVVGVLFYDDISDGLIYGAIWYLLTWVGVLAVRATPLYLARPLSFGLFCAAYTLSLYVLDAPAGFEWFGPLLFIKLVYGHSVAEEPYDRKR